MTYEEIKDFIGENVILEDVDEQIFIGRITNTESEFDTSSGKEEIEIKVGNCYVGIPFDEIRTIEKLNSLNDGKEILINRVKYADYLEVCNAFGIEHKKFFTYVLNNLDVSSFGLLAKFIPGIQCVYPTGEYLADRRAREI